jgi:hypothetical protein
MAERSDLADDSPCLHEAEATRGRAAGRPEGAGSVLPDLVASLAAIGRSMQEEFDPQRFLDEFSAQVQRLIPHDRLVIDLLDEDRRTFTVFTEHAPRQIERTRLTVYPRCQGFE